jgi:hypothetical protein
MSLTALHIHRQSHRSWGTSGIPFGKGTLGPVRNPEKQHLLKRLSFLFSPSCFEKLCKIIRWA